MDNIFRFSDFEADRERYQLRKGKQPIKLERIPLDILFLLLENPGKLVSRTQIVAKVWGNDLFLDSDRSINTAIRKIRKALGDDPQHQRFIETVVGQGYRFVATVTSENWTRHYPPDIRADSEVTGNHIGNCEIRLRDFVVEARSAAPVLTCDVVVGEVSLGRFTLLELKMPADVTLPLKPLDRLLVSLHGVRATLTSDASQALNFLCSHILQNGSFSVPRTMFQVSESSDDRSSMQFAGPPAMHSHG